MHQVGEKMDGTKKLVVKVKNASMHTKTAKAVSWSKHFKILEHQALLGLKHSRS